ncbi:plasmid replication initiator TrfA [Azomonas macrocytogenes]|uniref:Uncharacterized protein n=1 Tax=Azomonas macrocytogenes TaxID=69962 RepID=A0A839T7H9_AZOMA|nr:plasmid replication initiator TrfA [Azomonas macrocytogenes]MBB3105422.1 hypothetical protein [Azomonas macrocytogenes]
MTEHWGLLDKLKHMEERNIRSKEADASVVAPILQPAQVIRLPLWPEGVRGVPNSVLRCALFGAIRRGKRAYQDAVRKTSVDGVTVIHSGPQLDQADLDVWEQCLHLTRIEGLGLRIQFSAHSFLKSIGRSTGKSQHEWLKGALRRLMTSLVELKDCNKVYAGQLLHDWGRDEETGEHIIEMNPRIVAMYGGDGWTQIEWAERHALKGQPLAQWLHGFYTSHAKAYPYKVETLYQLSGSEAKQLKHFKAELKQALERVNEVTRWSWLINTNNLVVVDRLPSVSQQRYLKQKTEVK